MTNTEQKELSSNNGFLFDWLQFVHMIPLKIRHLWPRWDFDTKRARGTTNFNNDDLLKLYIFHQCSTDTTVQTPCFKGYIWLRIFENIRCEIDSILFSTDYLFCAKIFRYE